ncbi:MAG: hypothetical protein AB1668_04700 [Nanoarchaeota archaeon]
MVSIQIQRDSWLMDEKNSGYLCKSDRELRAVMQIAYGFLEGISKTDTPEDLEAALRNFPADSVDGLDVKLLVDEFGRVVLDGDKLAGTFYLGRVRYE